MRIGMIIDKPFPPDIRVEKESRALLDAGHEVTVLTSQNGQPESCDALPGLRIMRTRTEPITFRAMVQSRLNMNPRRRLRLIAKKLLRPAADGALSWRRAVGRDEDSHFLRSGVARTWIRAIDEFVLETRPQALHVHDFLLVPTALTVGRRRSIPVVADLHENWPAALQAYALGHEGQSRRNFEAAWDHRVWRARERQSLPRCAAVLVVVPEAADRLYDYGVSERQVVLVSNSEDESTFAVEPSVEQLTQRYAGRWVALYIGTIGYHRGLDVAVRALPEAAAENPDLLLVVVGARGNTRDKLQQLIDSLGVGSHVEIVEWLPSSEVPAYVAASSVGIIPHRNLEHTNTTVPHKLFQFMLDGKPVIVSSCPPLKRIVEETRCGRVFTADDPHSCAQALIGLRRDRDACEAFGRNGRDAATGAYAWREDARRMVELYGSLTRHD